MIRLIYPYANVPLVAYRRDSQTALWACHVIVLPPTGEKDCVTCSKSVVGCTVLNRITVVVYIFSTVCSLF